MAQATPDIWSDTAATALPQLAGTSLPELDLCASWNYVGQAISHILEFSHTTCGLPWWAAIASTTVMMRLAIFPIIMSSTARTERLKGVPEIKVLQEKMTTCKSRGDQMGSMAAMNKIRALWKKHDINPLKTMLGTVVQVPIFIGFFWFLRRMTDLPVESLHTGGMLWFSDLVAMDPYVLLPVMTSATMLFVIETSDMSSMQQGTMSANSMLMMKWFMRLMSVALIPMTYQFPAAILVYWFTANLLALGQTHLIKIAQVREYFKLKPLAAVPVTGQTYGDEFREISAKLSSLRTRFSESARQKQEVEEQRVLEAAQQLQRERMRGIRTRKKTPQSVEDFLKVGDRIVREQQEKRRNSLEER